PPQRLRPTQAARTLPSSATGAPLYAIEYLMSSPSEALNGSLGELRALQPSRLAPTPHPAASPADKAYSNSFQTTPRQHPLPPPPSARSSARPGPPRPSAIRSRSPPSRRAPCPITAFRVRRPPDTPAATLAPLAQAPENPRRPAARGLV